eukprot:1155103-Pelagomonas_calceolata.AAC.2
MKQKAFATSLTEPLYLRQDIPHKLLTLHLMFTPFQSQPSNGNPANVLFCTPDALSPQEMNRKSVTFHHWCGKPLNSETLESH